MNGELGVERPGNKHKPKTSFRLKFHDAIEGLFTILTP